MIQLPLPLFDDKPTPEDRRKQQLVEIREYLHVWNERERAMRIHAVTQPSGMSGAEHSNQRQAATPRT